MVKWKKMSQGMVAFMGVVGVLTAIQHSMHHHDEHEDDAPPPPYMKIRNKPYPWTCTDCDFFDSACHKECKAKLAGFNKAVDEVAKPEQDAEEPKKKVDPYFDLILNEKIARNEYPKEELDAARAADPCLAAQVCTEEVWNKYKDLKSSGPAKWTLARAINSGVMYPSSFVGCHAGDFESWDDFKDFFYPVVKLYHVGFDPDNTPPLDPDHMNPDKITVDLSDSAKTKIISTRIRCARNLIMFPLNPGGSLETRMAIADLMEQVYATLEGDLGGQMFRHTTMTDEQRQGLIDSHHLFRGKDKMQAASGYHEHWPQGRGVFHNAEKTFVNWINEGDHLRIISMENGSDVKGVFARLARGAKAIEDGVKQVTGKGDGVFMMHPKFGSVACCPSNLGTGMRGSVHILVPGLIEKKGFDWIDAKARTMHCQARGSSGEHSEVVDRIDVSNWRRIGLPEYQLVTDMITFANWLSEQEDKIQAGQDVEG
uniref:Phosphagen kinase C-terminal domain-containing protein n=1 Tax=Heterosigma akashiwo TaxID=2829 RepID=A0A7S3Y537_HETAK